MFTFFRPLPCVVAVLVASSLPGRAEALLDLSTLGAATQSGSSANPAALAVDGNTGTFSETPDVTNSFWEIELPRKVRMTRVELVAQSTAANGLVLRVQDLRDRTLFQATVSGATAGGTWATNLPATVNGRIVRFALENGLTNGAGNFRVQLAEVRVYGDASPAFGPVSLGAVATAVQSSTNGTLTPAFAIDGAPTTASETLDATDSYWLATFDSDRAIQRVELLNTTNAANAARLQGLTVRILNAASNSVASTAVPGVATGANWIYTPPANTVGRYLKIGLEGGAANGQGNRIVSLAELNVLTATNLGAGKPAYVTHDADLLPPGSNVNDDNYATAGGTSGLNTHDFFWEMNLGQPAALYDVRIATAVGFRPNLTNATLTVLDGNYNPVCVMNLSNAASEVWDVALPAPVFGQWVRVGFEYAQRSGGIGAGANWTLDMKEVQAFGRPTNEVGLLNFTASPTQIVASASTTLQWQEADTRQLMLYPNIGSVGSNTLAGGNGSLTLSPASSTEFTLVGFSYSNNFPRQVTVEVNGQKLPPQISEFVADNQFSQDDGNGNASDWIELHNPNNTSLDIGNYYLSDDPAVLTKWQFPSGTVIAPHGYLIVFADSAGAGHIYDAANYLHANFGLDSGGESLVLTGTNGVTVLDGITNFPAQTSDLAYGRTLDGQWKFLEPTPFAPNVATSYDGWLATPDFDHKRGWFTNAFTLAITNTDPLAQIFWSTNGFEPATLYTGPLNIAGTTGVRASVQRAGYKSPRIKTHTFLFLNDIMTQPVMSTTYTQSATYTNRLRQGFLDLPVICINVPPADAKWNFLAYNADRPERAASMEIFMPDGSNIQQDCGIIHLGGQFGTGTGLYTKKTWQLNFKSQYGAKSLNFPLFTGFDHGILAHEKFKELDIHAGNQDQPGSGGRGFDMSHAFANDTMLDMGDLNPHTRWVQVFTNGVYMGQFCVNERLTDAFLAEYLGGSKSDYLTVKGNDNTGTYGFIPGVADGPDRSAYDFVRSNMANYATVKSWVDVTNNIDFMLMWQWGNAESEFRSAMPRTAGKGGFKVWLADADGLLRQQSGVAGQLSKNNITSSTQFTWGPGWIFSNLLHEANSDFKTLLADRIYKHFFNGGAMTPTALTARLDKRMAEITNSMVAECARWGATLSGYDPVKWQTDAAYARANLFPVRSGTIFSQMRSAGWYPSFDPPTLGQYGGNVTNGYKLNVSAPGGTVYYTLDGSDPRLPGGGISSNAIAWVAGAATTNIVNVVNIPLGSTWRYYNTNTAPAGAWTTVAYADSAWPSGATPMGYPQPDGVTFATVLNYGTNSSSKWISYYFRQSFAVTNLAGITNLSLGLNRDDGAVIYLNGTELMRDNMAAGTVTNGTFATNAVSGANETAVFQFTVPANLLVTGTNVVAVEIHQDAINSTDLHFDFSLAGAVTNITSVSNLTVTITNATTISLRVLNGGTWSALASTTFYVAPLRQPNPGELIISEMHYHPPDSDNYEFVELWNATTNQLDLTGVQLRDGIDFVFPNNFTVAPGGFVLAVKDVATFTARYANSNSPYYYPGLKFAGSYSGKLSDSGERIALLASNNAVLCEVTYQDSGAWPTRADGNGSSLELRDLNAAAAMGTNVNVQLARGANWRASSLWAGSPGRFDSAAQNIVINELLAHTDLTVDWIEFQNQTASAIDLGGLYLSDGYNNLFKYYIPANTVLPANGFLSLSTTNFSFAFSELGESATLVQATGTNVLRFVDAVDFPASDQEVSFGRFVRSDGVADFTELRANTEDAANALPLVGPAVFSEIMYKPATNHGEFVEIVNLTPTNLPMFHPQWPTNTWHVAGGISFAFPTNQSIPPGSAIIVCDTNAAAFRAQYGIGTNVTVYGPYSGALNNAGDEVRLEYAGVPETNGFVAYYRMDHVRYEPVSPWPTNAVTGGYSLERVTLERYGNDPDNWTASVTNGTPGIFSGNRQPVISVNGDTTVLEGDTVALTVSVSDPDEPWQTVTLSGQDLPDGNSFVPATGQFSWPTVETNGPGIYSLRFIVTDSGAVPMTRTQTVVVTVLESNLPPALGAVAGTIFPAQLPFALDLAATDADWPTNVLTYAATGLPAGITLNSANGQIRGSAQTPGTYPVSVSVSDNGVPSLVATNGFTLTITPPFTVAAAFSGAATAFAFQSLAGENYDVQYSTTLSPPAWQLLQHLTNAPGGSVGITNIPAGPQCFLRVLWLH